MAIASAGRPYRAARRAPAYRFSDDAPKRRRGGCRWRRTRNAGNIAAGRGGMRAVYGVEALPRWKNSTPGQVAPSSFFSISEQVRLIAAIGRWLLCETACRQRVAWQGIGADKFRVSATQYRGAHRHARPQLEPAGDRRGRRDRGAARGARSNGMRFRPWLSFQRARRRGSVSSLSCARGSITRRIPEIRPARQARTSTWTA